MSVTLLPSRRDGGGNHSFSRKLASITAVLLSVILAGCADTVSAPTLSTPPIVAFDATTAPIGPVSAKAAPGVPMESYDLERVTQTVQSDLAATYPARIVGGGASSPREVKIHMIFTAYDKGNAFARAMLAGLGQIHIKANVELIDANSGDVTATYAVSKTFAWGGIYGASTSIEDVEKGFAASVAAIFKTS